MRVGIIVVCRYDSTRLPGKVLRQIEAKPVLSYIFERVKKVSKACDVVVATSNEKSEDPIEEFCQQNVFVDINMMLPDECLYALKNISLIILYVSVVIIFLLIMI